MALSNITTDRRYAMPGDAITITATLGGGSRFRARLMRAPVDSALELYDASKENYIGRNVFVPDVPGRYYFDLDEETVTAEAPRFSNDLGDATDHGGTSRGTESVTLVSTTSGFAVTVGQRVTREIGIAPDAVTFDGYAHVAYDDGSGTGPDDTSFPGDPLATQTGGLITAYADRTRSPRLILDGTTDAARIAASSNNVAAAMRDLGAVGSSDHVYGVRYGEGHAIMPWNRIVFDPIAEFGWTTQRFNTHIVASAIGLHTAADAVNTLAAPAGVTIAQQITFLNNARTALIGHVQLVGVGPVHATADTLSLADIPAALAVGATQNQCIDRTNLLWWILDEHMTRIWPASTSAIADDAVHPAGDARLNAVATPLAVDATTATARQAAIRVAYEAHRQRTAVTLGPYHDNVGTTAEQYTDALPDNRDSYVTAVGTLLGLLRNHLSNVDAAGAATVYHTAIDTTLAALTTGTPSTFEDAVRYHEMINWILATHALKGSPVHGGSYPSGWRPTVHGIEALHHAFRSELLYTTSAVPPTEVYAASKLIMLGGFKKG